MVIHSQQSELEARFGHLLQPIRDLTKNWDVNIASQLEDYLDEIGSIAITFDGGQTTLNFAEAALLIQGSACVYSKKVEYLHALVYQVLDLLANKKKLQQAASVDANGNDQDAQFGNKDHDEEFLSLDDIKDHKNIDMKEDREGHLDKTTHVLPRVTLSLIPLEEGEKGHNPLLSHKGEVLGSRNDFRMNTSNIHPSGTLLLDLSHLNLLELSFQNRPHSTPFVPRAMSRLTDLPPCAATEDEGIAVDDGLPDDVSMVDNLPPPEDNFQSGEDIPMETEERDGMQLRRSERTKNAIAKAVIKENIDPFKHVDPHAESGTTKVFKKKPMYKSIDGEDTNKRKRKKNTVAVGQQRLDLLSLFCRNAFYNKPRHLPKQPLHSLTLPQIEDLYSAEYKNRQQRARAERKRLEQLGRAREAQEEEQDQQEDDDNFHEPLPDGGDDDASRHVDFQVPEVTVNGLDPVLEPVDGLGMEPPGLDFDVDDGPVLSSYEELVKQHVEGYMASAQQYAQITELSRRVTEWEEKILPKLEEEERHGAFDIHKYGSDVLDTLKVTGPGGGDTEDSPGETVHFGRVCRNRQPYEVCRLFLATLQLANNYNVEISSEGAFMSAMDTMSLRMLSSRRHFEELQEYRAPSVDQ